MRILFIGDIVGEVGVNFVAGHLRNIKNMHGVDFCIANGENSAANGITPKIADALLFAGVDVITLGNHAFSKHKELVAIFDRDLPVVRPLNYPSGVPGFGYCVVNCVVDSYDIKIAVINIMGRVYLENIDSPFSAIDKLLVNIKDEAQVFFVDFHAEVTSEKLAMAHFLDGRVSALVGTHTHVQTADECVMPKGMAYITDVGMTGPVNSILGAEPQVVLDRYLTGIHQRFGVAKDRSVSLCGVLVDVDVETGKATGIERLVVS